MRRQTERFSAKYKSGFTPNRFFWEVVGDVVYSVGSGGVCEERVLFIGKNEEKKDVILTVEVDDENGNVHSYGFADYRCVIFSTPGEAENALKKSAKISIDRIKWFHK